MRCIGCCRSFRDSALLFPSNCLQIFFFVHRLQIYHVLPQFLEDSICIHFQSNSAEIFIMQFASVFNLNISMNTLKWQVKFKCEKKRIIELKKNYWEAFSGFRRHRMHGFALTILRLLLFNELTVFCRIKLLLAYAICKCSP